MNIEEILARMQEIVSGAETENRSLNEDEVTQYETLEKDLKAARKTEEIRSRQSAWATPQITSGIVRAEGSGDEVLERAFEDYLRTGQRNMDLAELRAQGTGTDSAGGYLVPVGFRQKLTERMKAFGGIQNVAETITTETGNDIEWPTVDDTANSGEIVAEHGTGAAGADIVFGTKTLGAYKYMSLGAGNLPLRVSVELLQDAAFDVSGFVAKALGKRIARAQAADFATGAGTTEPLGLMSKAASVTLATSSGNITYAKLLDLVHSVDPEYRESAGWVFNDTILKVVRQLEDNNGRPLWLPDGSGMGTLPGGSLLGYPVTIDQGIAGLGDAAKIMAFGDIAEAYVIRRVRDVQLVVDPYGRAANGEVQFTAWARADATVQNTNAYATLADFDAP
jgi:HK97 family phage major capsid protein